MSQNSDSTTISIQFQIAGRSVLLRNALIGLVLGISFGSLAATRYWMSPLVALVAPSIGGLALGGFTALMALFGQMAAPAPYEGQRQIQWPAIRYAGLIAASVGVFITGMAAIGSMHSFGVALLITTAGAVIGALIMLGLTLIISVLKRVAPKRSAAQLTERQFDPLQHIESREHARR
jgi:hypothetical protein